jgi:single-strand DNA-binding protein
VADTRFQRIKNKYTGGKGMNSAQFVGRLTKDPEMRYTQANNTAVAGFTLAVNRRIKQVGQPEADFIPVVAWQKTAEFCNKYFRKGQQVWVQGRIQTRTWDDNDGKTHYVTELVAEQVGFADSKKDGNGNGQAAAPAQSQQSGKPAASTPSNPPSSPPQQAGEKMPWE